MSKPASEWSDEKIEMFFEHLLARGTGYLKVGRRDNLIILQGASGPSSVFSVEQFKATASEIEHYIER